MSLVSREKRINKRKTAKKDTRNRRGPKKNNNTVPGEIRELNRIPTQRERSIDLVRTTNSSISWSGTTGWSATNFFDLEFQFNLASVNIFTGGVLLSSVAIPGFGDISQLFEWWRLNKIEMQIFASANGVQQTTAGTSTALPTLLIVFDPNESAALTLSQALQYESLRIVQPASVRNADGYSFSAKPTPLMLAANATTSGSGWFEPSKGPNPFVSTGSAAVQHYGVKMYLDTALAASASNTGVFTFYIRSHFTVKDTI